jgi:hypothetical protein
MKTNLQNHTPGDWSISEYPNGFNLEIVAPDGIVCTAKGTSGTKAETRANARLIAASPDLLAALESTEALACDLFEDLIAYEDRDRQGQVRAICDKARAAILKATEGK